MKLFKENKEDFFQQITQSIAPFFIVQPSVSKVKSQIIHLGGTRIPTFNPENKGCALDRKAYFYEQIPIQTENGNIHIYGNKLKVFFDRWKLEVKKNKTSFNFPQWIKKLYHKEHLTEIIHRYGVRFFSSKELKQTEVHINEKGLFSQIGLDAKDHQLKPLTSREYAYVIGQFFDQKTQKPIKKLFATPKVHTSKGKIQHSSFFQSGNVLSAGMIRLTDHDMIEIKGESGHYKPYIEEIREILDYLNQKNIPLSKVKIICSRDTFQEFIESFFMIFTQWGFSDQKLSQWLANKNN